MLSAAEVNDRRSLSTAPWQPAVEIVGKDWSLVH